MLKINDNLFNKNQIRCIQQKYFQEKSCDGLYIEYINGSSCILYKTTIKDIIDLEKVSEE